MKKLNQMSKDKVVFPIGLTVKTKLYIKEEDIEEIIVKHQGGYEKYIETMTDVSGFDNYDYEKRDLEKAISLYIKSSDITIPNQIKRTRIA